MVDLPDPDGPTNPIFSPFFIIRLKLFKTIASLSGYLNTTFLNSISPSKFFNVLSSVSSAIYTSSVFSTISNTLAPACLAFPISGIN